MCSRLMAGRLSAEVISFRRPDCPKNAIFVSPVVPDDDEADINICLEKRFSVYGLIYQIILKDAKDKKGQTYQYAVVKFYSSNAAKRAIQDLNGKQTCAGHPIRVCLSMCVVTMEWLSSFCAGKTCLY
jgi:hypothetical protein